MDGSPVPGDEVECRVEGDALLIASEHIACDSDVAVRFAKTGFYQVNLFNGAGIPAMPFELSGKE